MNVLGIDWGEKKIGVSLASGTLAEPIEVIRYEHASKLFARLKEICTKYGIEKIIVGVSEGSSAIAAKNFATVLQKELGLTVETYDETLSSFDAQELSRLAGQNRKKRKNMEDAFAATVMLQNYLDERI
jgi:putative Holliday junction resolvase